MKKLLLVWLGCLNLTYAIEYFVSKNQSDFLIEGRYLNEQNNSGKEFWICVDYETTMSVRSDFGNDYPFEKCGGQLKISNSDRLYWYTIHGLWKHDNQLDIHFESRYQLWPSKDEDTQIAEIDSFLWVQNVLNSSNTEFKILQRHTNVNHELKRFDIDTLLMINSRGVHVAGVKTNSQIHVRARIGEETGIELNKVLETDYERGSEVDESSTKSPTNSEELVSTSRFYHDLDRIIPKLDDKNPIEEITTEPMVFSSTNRHSMDMELLDTDQSYEKETNATEEAWLFLHYPEIEEPGIRARPFENIPFVDISPVGMSTLDQNLQKPSSQKQSSLEFENEIVEEDMSTSTDWMTTAENLLKNEVVRRDLLSSGDDELTVKKPDYKYQTLYNVAIITALIFFCFFIAIVAFRCYAWNKPNKASYNFFSTQQEQMIHTSGSIASLPTKVLAT